MHAGSRRIAIAILISALVIVWVPGLHSTRSAHADDAVTTQRVALRGTPEESAKPIKRLPAGVTVQVLKRDGRWLYVRAGDTKGWLTRTTVSENSKDDGKDGERSPAWGDKANKWGEGSSTNGSDTVAAASNDRTDDRTTDDEQSDAVTATVNDASSALPSSLPRLAINGQIGFRSIGMDFTSDGQQSSANYVISAQAVTAAVAVHTAGKAGPLRMRASLQYRGAYSDPGVRYQASSGGTDDIALTSHEIDLDTGVGIRASDSLGGIDVFARLGYMYGAYMVDDVNNLGKLPNESLSGISVGASIRLANLTDTVSLVVDAGILVNGARAQTAGLEDGMTSFVSATQLRARLAHPVSKHLELVGEYEYSARVTVWEGGSARHTNVSRADRHDTLQTFSAGLARTF